MSAYVLITGALSKTVEKRSSKNGNPFALANIRVKDGDSHVYWRVFAFNEQAIAELAELSEGDAVSLSGAMKADIYQSDGKPPRVSLTLMADKVLALKPKPKAYRAKKPSGSPYVVTPATIALANKSQGLIDPDLNDDWRP